MTEGGRQRYKSEETDKQTGIADVQWRHLVTLTAYTLKWHEVYLGYTQAALYIDIMHTHTYLDQDEDFLGFHGMLWLDL